MKFLSKFLLAATAVCMVATGCNDKGGEETPTYAITVAADANGTASATVGGAAAAKAEKGVTVTLAATANAGYVFSQWVVVSGGVTLEAGSATTSFEMPANAVSVKAEFVATAAAEYDIAVTDDGNGSAEATVGGAAVTKAAEGTTVNLAATAGEGYEFSQWVSVSGDAVFADASSVTTTFEMPANEVTVKAEFRLTPAAVYNNDADLWANTASFTLDNIPEGAEVSFSYRKQDGEWKYATIEGNTATISPEWTEGTNSGGHTIYTVNSDTGIFAKNTYEYQVFVNGAVAASGEFTPLNSAGDDITPFTDDLSCFTISNEDAAFWGSGNNSMATGLCTPDDSYAYMQGSAVMGVILAPGNLFTGTFEFVRAGILDSSSYGTVGFGQGYEYTARPTALQLKHTITFASTVYMGYDHSNAISEHDQASVVVCIMNWDERHGVTSGNNGPPTGGWNPVTLEGLSDDEKAGMIAYGVVYPEEDVTEETLLNIPLTYYDKDAAIPEGNYTIIISCSTSRYGEYLNGSANSFRVKDFEWVY